MNEIRQARTITIPGGVELTEEERLFREGCSVKKAGADLAIARSILAKVQAAVAVLFGVQ